MNEQANETTILSKISMKGIGAQPGKNSLKEGEKRRIAVVYGRTSGYEVGQTQYGDFTRFKGSFEAVNESGQRFKSGKIFLPGIVEDMLKDVVEGLEDGQSVDFALEIGVEYSEKGSTGYAFTVKPLIDLKESDELAQLRNAIVSKLPSLPAPEKTEKETKGKK